MKHRLITILTLSLVLFIPFYAVQAAEYAATPTTALVEVVAGGHASHILTYYNGSNATKIVDIAIKAYEKGSSLQPIFEKNGVAVRNALISSVTTTEEQLRVAAQESADAVINIDPPADLAPGEYRLAVSFTESPDNRATVAGGTQIRTSVVSLVTVKVLPPGTAASAVEQESTDLPWYSSSAMRAFLTLVGIVVVLDIAVRIMRRRRASRIQQFPNIEYRG